DRQRQLRPIRLDVAEVFHRLGRGGIERGLARGREGDDRAEQQGDEEDPDDPCRTSERGVSRRIELDVRVAHCADPGTTRGPRSRRPEAVAWSSVQQCPPTSAAWPWDTKPRRTCAPDRSPVGRLRLPLEG